MVDQKMYELGTRKSTIRDVFEYGRKLAAAEGEDKVFDFSLEIPMCLRRNISGMRQWISSRPWSPAPSTATP